MHTYTYIFFTDSIKSIKKYIYKYINFILIIRSREEFFEKLEQLVHLIRNIIIWINKSLIYNYIVVYKSEMSIVLRSLSKASRKQSKSKEIYDTSRKYRSRANSSIVRFPLLNKYREHRRERSEEKVPDQTERKIFFSLANSKRSRSTVCEWSKTT